MDKTPFQRFGHTVGHLLFAVRNLPLFLCALFVSGCAHAPLSLISLDGSQTDDLSRVSVIMEDKHHPALLRGVDGVPIKSQRMPSPFGAYAYVIRAGNHVFWLKGAPYPEPFIPQRIRCYMLHVDLTKGDRYLLREAVEQKKAILVRADTGAVESTGEVVDEPWVFARDCKWN